MVVDEKEGEGKGNQVKKAMKSVNLSKDEGEKAPIQHKIMFKDFLKAVLDYKLEKHAVFLAEVD